MDQFEIVDTNGLRLPESMPARAHRLINDKESAIGGQLKYVRMVIRRKDQL